MAALALFIVGSAAGGAVFGPTDAIAGRLIGALAGNVIDQALFGRRERVGAYHGHDAALGHGGAELAAATTLVTA